MTDDYICSVCGHRAGDHAVSNRCIANDCDCKDDPYLEQLSALQAKLAIAVDAMQECVDNYSTEAKFVMKLRLETTIARLEEK